MLIAEYSYEEDVEAQREESWEAGKKEGKAEGRAEGKAEGRAEGKAEGIRGAVALLREMSLPETEIEERIRNQFCLTDDQARSYMQEQ